MITTYHLRQLAGKGDPDAQFRLAYRLVFGRRRVGSAWSRAARWWTLAAAQGHPRAQFYLGTCYDQGRGVAKNLVKAMRLDRSRAIRDMSRGSEVAAFLSIGDLLRKGNEAFLPARSSLNFADDVLAYEIGDSDNLPVNRKTNTARDLPKADSHRALKVLQLKITLRYLRPLDLAAVVGARPDDAG